MTQGKEIITENPFAIMGAVLSRIEFQNEQILRLLQSKYNQSDSSEIGGINLAMEVTRLSKARIYTLVAERTIPHKKRGNRLTFRRSELLAWLDEGSRSTESVKN
ncbi:helix-turn-helix domain-containing protein [Spirosoma aerolatum]|uniref:helix-turn-helix domain-containing protein n=1 Tax=Spirosoma aerolatum TaxID=1211326 RepID=UPI0009ADE455|nr:helix-turn-helix domain-containing protein [Spirosoma aerolatum]